MKNTLLTILSAVCFAVTNAQISIAPVAGLNVSGYTVKSYVGYDGHMENRLGFCGGVLADVPLNNRFSIQAGLLYKMNGYRQKDQYRSASAIYEGLIAQRVSTLDLPVRMLYSFSGHKGNTFFVGAGPYFAVNVSAVFYAREKTFDLAGNKIHDIEVIDYQKIGRPWSSILRYDAGAGLCVGYQMRNGIVVSIQGQKGFRTVVIDNQFGDWTAKNYNYGIVAGYNLKLKKRPAQPDKQQSPS